MKLLEIINLVNESLAQELNFKQVYNRRFGILIEEEMEDIQGGDFGIYYNKYTNNNNFFVKIEYENINDGYYSKTIIFETIEDFDFIMQNKVLPSIW